MGATGTAAGRGLSIWWATPSRPDRHFTADELARSSAHHRPVRLVGLAGLVARVVLLVVAAWIAGRIADRIGGGPAPTLDRALVGALLVVVPIRAVAVVADGWFEYRHETRRDDHRPVPKRWFAAVGMALTAVAIAAVAIVCWLCYQVISVSPRWPWLIGIAVVSVVVAFVGLERPVRSLAAGQRERPLAPHTEPWNRFDGLARHFRLPGLPFMVRAGATGERLADADPFAGGIRGLNAYATGIGRHRRVVVAEPLLEQPASIRDFVVAHELTHLARHHVLAQTVLSTGSLLVGLAGLVALTDTGRPWSWFGLDPFDPIGLPVVAVLAHLYLGAVGPIVAWLARAQERAADVGAIAAVGCPGRDDATRLHRGDAADLDPPLWLRLYSHHPTPPERLEFLARHRH